MIPRELVHRLLEELRQKAADAPDSEFEHLGDVMSWAERKQRELRDGNLTAESERKG
jgi:hypothetical protein